MGRPKTKDGIRTSVYIRRDLYDRLIKSLEDGESISSVVDRALEYYLNNVDIIKEFEELSEKYAAIISKVKKTDGNIISKLKETVKNDMSWKEAMIKIGVEDPIDMVSYFREYTTPVNNMNDIRVLTGTENIYLIKPENAKSILDFIFKIKRNMHSSQKS